MNSIFRLSRQSLVVFMLCLTFIVCSFPLDRQAHATSGFEIAVGEIRMFAYNSVPDGWVYCNGQTLENTAATQKLIVLLQTRFGAMGTVPDLRAKESNTGVGYYIATEGVDPYSGFDLNSVVGEIRIFAFGITPTNFQSASGQLLSIASYPDLSDHIAYFYGGNGTYFNSPYIGDSGTFIQGVGYYIATSGVILENMTPSDNFNYLGAISMFSVPVSHSSLLKANGVPLDISSNSALYSLYGTRYGGNGINTFGIPNLATDYAGPYVSSNYYVHNTGLYPAISGAAPTTSSDSYSVTQSTYLSVDSPALGVSNNDSNATAVYLYTEPSHGTVNLSPDGTFVYYPIQDYFGTDSFTYRASNNYASSDVTTVYVTVEESAPVEEPIPVISGVVDGGTYSSPTVISYTNGTGTLDGLPFTSGSTVSGVGSHTFVVTTPLGATTIISFTVMDDPITVSFYYNDGTMVSSQSVIYNYPLSEPSTPTRAGYIFGGWYKEAALINEWNFYEDKVTGPMTLFAKWTPDSYEVGFMDEGNLVTNMYAVYDTTITAPTAPTKDHYSFEGWYKEAALINEWNFNEDKLTGPMTLYAKWTPDTYTVSLHNNDGTGITSLAVAYNNIAKEPLAPTRTGYIFGGWYTDSEFNTPYIFTEAVTEDIHLFAKWDSITNVSEAVAIAELYETQRSVNQAMILLIQEANGTEKDSMIARLEAVQIIINSSTIHIGDITKQISEGTLQDINQDDIIDLEDIRILLDRIKFSH
jgi:uncharacterized repeat protein (TIGR02543 family)